jgi:hypothetical protein
MSEPKQVDLDALWQYVTQQVKGEIVLPSLWRAMEAARPMLISGDELVLGFPGAQAHQRGLLLDVRHRNFIEQTLERATRLNLRLRLIEGDTLADWEMAQQQAVEAGKQQQAARQEQLRKQDAGRTWEGVIELLTRKFSALAHRSLPSVQARFLAESVETLAEAYGRLMPENPTELEERAYCRALDRVGERAGVSSTVVALLVIQRREKR